MSFIKFLVSKIFWKQVAIAVVGVGLLVFMLFQWLRITTNHSQKIEVPDLSKLHIEKAEQTLKDLNLRVVVRDSASYNPDFPKQSVIRQNPEVGDIVKENRKIYLTLNPSSYRLIMIPNAALEGNGRTKRNVETTLKAAGFIIGNKPTYVPFAAKNYVRGLKHNGKKITKGTKLPKKSVINLILGDGND